MKVLIINGSPRINGNCARLIEEATKEFDKANIEYEIYQLGNKDIKGCMGCGYCHTHHECVIKDDVKALSDKFNIADGLLIASPVYYGSANGSMISC